uniref:Uncharacterized protein n=1 Tax=Knipowitschia caucasica TaxID=637954 RepID=A0AAV2ME34_KNICA
MDPAPNITALDGVHTEEAPCPAPHPVTPSAPHPVTPSAPHPVTPSAPHPVTPSAPHPVTPSAPHPVTPSAPHPVTPSAPQFTLLPLQEADGSTTLVNHQKHNIIIGPHPGPPPGPQICLPHPHCAEDPPK